MVVGTSDGSSYQNLIFRYKESGQVELEQCFSSFFAKLLAAYFMISQSFATTFAAKNKEKPCSTYLYTHFSMALPKPKTQFSGTRTLVGTFTTDKKPDKRKIYTTGEH